MATKKKKDTISKAKNRAWNWFSRYIRMRDALEATGDTEYAMCITCGVALLTHGVGCAQAGHAISGRNKAILFDEEIVHVQCPKCNIFRSGNLDEYATIMINRHGMDWWEAKMRKKHEPCTPWNVVILQDLEQEYKARATELGWK